MALVNDLFSYRREYLAGGQANAVIALVHGGYGLQEAVTVVCDRILLAEAD